MGNISREMGIPSKTQKGRLEIGNTATDMKNTLMGSLVDWTWLRKEPLS